MKKFKALACILVLTQVTTFCSLERFRQSIARLASNSSMRMRRVAKPVRPLATFTATYVTTALGTFKFLQYRRDKKRSQEAQQYIKDRDESRIKWLMDEAANQAHQKEIETRVSGHFKTAYSNALASLYKSRLSEGKETFLKKTQAFAQINGLTINQVAQSFAANREAIAKMAEHDLHEICDNSGNSAQQKAVTDLQVSIPHLKNLDTIAQDLKYLSTTPCDNATK